MKSFFLPFVLITFLFSNCNKQETEQISKKQYIFLGHSYDWLAGNKIDPRLLLLDYSQYEGVWLGGDNCSHTTKEPGTVQYLDSIFNLSNPNSHWTVGNHDLLDGNIGRITEVTKRPFYYTHCDDGMCVLVLNTNLYWQDPDDFPGLCEERDRQLAFIQNFCDTLSYTKNLVILHHHAILNELRVNEKGEMLKLDNVNFKRVRSTCEKGASLTHDFYHYLVELKSRGVNVFCIAGDVGMVSKGYHIETKDGIHLLGSGINNSMNMDYPAPYVKNFNPDTVLIVERYLENDSLGFNFVNLSELAGKEANTSDWLDKRLRTLLKEY